MKLYNTLTRQIEEFKPQNPEEVKVYTCGPTVYGYPHIGNYASYVFWDLLVRSLKMNGYGVKRVLNLTDVGHLTSDEDSGEDKMEKGAKKEGKTVWEIADFYIDDFLKNFRALNLITPDLICRATDYIDSDKELVEKMLKDGFAYETEDGVYFDTSKFPEYANFARLDLKGLKAGARVEYNSEKRNVSDFAIWKFIGENEKHAMRWDFLGRPGYPGWHLECSAIIHKELGEPIDIHTGGVDHIPVHHTNEIAQSYAISQKPLANYWLHCNFITVDGRKISKSLGNIITFKDLEEKGFTPIDFKTWVLEGSYQGERNFTFEALAAARQRRLNWRNKIAMKYQPVNFDFTSVPDITPQTDRLINAINNNLNSAEAFAIIDQFDSETPLILWEYVDNLFGLNLLADSKNISEEQQSLIDKREEARDHKNYEAADKLRAELEKTGVTVKDTAAGPIWQYI